MAASRRLSTRLLARRWHRGRTPDRHSLRSSTLLRLAQPDLNLRHARVTMCRCRNSRASRRRSGLPLRRLKSTSRTIPTLLCGTSLISLPDPLIFGPFAVPAPVKSRVSLPSSREAAKCIHLSDSCVLTVVSAAIAFLECPTRRPSISEGRAPMPAAQLRLYSSSESLRERERDVSRCLASPHTSVAHSSPSTCAFSFSTRAMSCSSSWSSDSDTAFG